MSIDHPARHVSLPRGKGVGGGRTEWGGGGGGEGVMERGRRERGQGRKGGGGGGRDGGGGEGGGGGPFPPTHTQILPATDELRRRSHPRAMLVMLAILEPCSPSHARSTGCAAVLAS